MVYPSFSSGATASDEGELIVPLTGLKNGTDYLLLNFAFCFRSFTVPEVYGSEVFLFPKFFCFTLRNRVKTSRP